MKTHPDPPASFMYEPASGRFLVHDIAITLDLRPGTVLLLEIDTDNLVWISAIAAEPPPAAAFTRPILTNDLSAIGIPPPAAELPRPRQPDKAPARSEAPAAITVPVKAAPAATLANRGPAPVAAWPLRSRPLPPIVASAEAVLPAGRLKKTSDRDKCPVCHLTLKACRGAYGSEHQ